MWAYLIVWVVSMVVSALLTPRPKTTTPEAGQLEAPMASTNAPIPVLFGTRTIKQPNCVWYGDVRTTPIRSSGGKK